MKWETYNKMTDSQKEEYNYRFKDQLPKAPFQSWIMTTIILWLVFGTVILAYYIAGTSTNPELTKIQPTLVKSMESFSGGVSLFTTVFIMYLVLWIFKVIYYFYSERKWLKQNGIKA